MKPINFPAKRIIFGVLSVAILAVIIVLVVRSIKAPRQATPTDQTPETITETGGTTVSDAPHVPVEQTVSTPTVVSVVTNVSSSAGATDADTKHGTFSVAFNVQAKDRDVYFNPSCQTANTSVANGVTYTLIKDGVRGDNTELGAASCVVLNRGIATQTPGGNYLIKAGQENVFELVVVHHPKESGNYKIRITQVGYSRIDGRGDTLFFISDADLGRLKTQANTL
jgi:hypothetical protein